MLKEVRLYIETSIRGPRRQTGAYAYVLEYRAAAGPVTLTEVKAIPDTTEHQSLCMGILAAVKRLKSCDLTICTSSGYIQAVFECWITGLQTVSKRRRASPSRMPKSGRK